MTDITNPRLLYIKAALFVTLGLLAGGLIVSQLPDWRIGLLLGISVWAFCRAYYFVFYVIEHYIDSKYRFAGLYDFVKYLAQRRRDAARQLVRSSFGDATFLDFSSNGESRGRRPPIHP